MWSLHHASRDRWPCHQWKAPAAHTDRSGSWWASALAVNQASISQDWKATWILLGKDLEWPLGGLGWCYYGKPSTQPGWENSKAVLTPNCRSKVDTELGWSGFASAGDLCPHTASGRGWPGMVQLATQQKHVWSPHFQMTGWQDPRIQKWDKLM